MSVRTTPTTRSAKKPATSATSARTISPARNTRTTPPALPSKARPLRFWVAGVPVGINHAQEGMGKQRHLTPEAQSWAGQVWANAFSTAQTQHLRGPAVWQVRTDGASGVLGVALHFVVPARQSTSGSRRIKRLDVDAPVKLTLDKLCEGFGLDDMAVRRLEVTHSLRMEATSLPGGYGATRCGVWISVWRMSAAEIRALDSVEPGPAA